MMEERDAHRRSYSHYLASSDRRLGIPSMVFWDWCQKRKIQWKSRVGRGGAGRRTILFSPPLNTSFSFLPLVVILISWPVLTLILIYTHIRTLKTRIHMRERTCNVCCLESPCLKIHPFSLQNFIFPQQLNKILPCMCNTFSCLFLYWQTSKLLHFLATLNNATMNMHLCGRIQSHTGVYLRMGISCVVQFYLLNQATLSPRGGQSSLLVYRFGRSKKVKIRNHPVTVEMTGEETKGPGKVTYRAVMLLTARGRYSTARSQVYPTHGGYNTA